MLPHFQSSSSSSLVQRKQRRGGLLNRRKGGGGLPLPSSRHNSGAPDGRGFCFCLWRRLDAKSNTSSKKLRRGGILRRHQITVLQMLLVALLIFPIFIMIVTNMLATPPPPPTTPKLEHTTVPGTAATPIYWINLDKSKDRMAWMSNMFKSLGLVNTHRIAAHDVSSTRRSWQDGTLVFHPLIKLVPRTAESIKWKDHSSFKYYYQEAACLLSHLKAIKQAYDDGNKHALILEDDAHLSNDFFQNLPSFLESAPPGWKVLQFSTNNVSV